MRNLLPVLLFLTFIICGCGGINTFTTDALQGSTIAVPAGWRQGFTRDNISVTFTDSATVETTYPVGDSRIRAVTNMYRDPVSSLVIDTRIKDPANYGQTINEFQTDYDDDWWQTMVFLDVPPMALGAGSLVINGPNSESYGPVDINIVAGTGTSDPLRANFPFGTVTLSNGMIGTLDRPPHYTLTFSGGATVPHAVEVTLTHDPDSTVGGTGRALAINPTGDAKALNWADDGTTMRVIMTRANDLVVDNVKDYKFYVAGGITSLSLGTVTAYDQDGLVITGVTASCAGGCI